MKLKVDTFRQVIVRHNDEAGNALVTVKASTERCAPFEIVWRDGTSVSLTREVADSLAFALLEALAQIRGEK